MNEIAFKMQPQKSDRSSMLYNRIWRSDYGKTVIFLVLIALAILHVMWDHAPEAKKGIYQVSAIILFGGIVMTLGIIKSIAERASKNPWLNEETQYLLDGEGFTLTTPTVEVWWAWEEIRLIEETPKFFFLFTRGRTCIVFYKNLLKTDTIHSIRNLLSDVPAAKKKLLIVNQSI